MSKITKRFARSNTFQLAINAYVSRSRIISQAFCIQAAGITKLDKIFEMK